MRGHAWTGSALTERMNRQRLHSMLWDGSGRVVRPKPAWWQGQAGRPPVEIDLQLTGLRYRLPADLYLLVPSHSRVIPKRISLEVHLERTYW